MATEAATGDGGVINIGATPGVAGVTGATVTTDHDMVTRFARCDAAVVTTVTGTGDCCVIDIGVVPAAGDVAVIAAVE